MHVWSVCCLSTKNLNVTYSIFESPIYKTSHMLDLTKIIPTKVHKSLRALTNNKKIEENFKIETHAVWHHKQTPMTTEMNTTNKLFLVYSMNTIFRQKFIRKIRYQRTLVSTHPTISIFNIHLVDNENFVFWMWRIVVFFSFLLVSIDFR